ncbi:MAG: protein kinase [Gordonia sp. (in: high G+C Gram-positive bacteria)]|uniref:serine/threonine-protein kinase n=1 Tax=Gordonia sp. (in: high G+C Gram-positive bacteria) TaxID=84139 RepID=UPI003BB5E021
MSTLQPGQVFAGYTIEALLGAGGMGEVYIARHPRLPRNDALKVLAQGLANDDAFRRRFEREADVVAGLSHPNIVKVHDRGEYDGRLWIAYDYIEGHDLADTARRTPPTPEQSARIISEVADALDAAGRRGLVHRDVKPANILIDADGRALLTDFGIARTENQAATQLTGTGTTLGTVAYASPEQLQALPIDPRSDQYSLACTAFALLTGTTPYHAHSATAAILAHVRNPIPSAAARRPALPPTVDGVFYRALAKNPADRFTTSTEFAAALRAALAGTAPTVALTPSVPRNAPAAPHPPGTTGLPPSAPTEYLLPDYRQPQPKTKRHRLPLILGTLIAVAILVVALIVVLPSSNDNTDKTDKTAAASAPSVNPEAATLDQIPVSPNLPSLANKPGSPVWDWKPDHDKWVDGLVLLGGTEKAVVFGEARSDFADNKITRRNILHVVDADTGKTRHSIPVPIDDYVSMDSCQAFTASESAICLVDSNSREGYTYVTVDLLAGTVSPVITSAGRQVATTGDTAVIISDDGVVAYGADGRKRWEAAASYPETVDPPAPLHGSPVVEVREGDVVTLRSVTDGAIRYRKDMANDLASAGNGSLLWTPLPDGFAVTDGTETVFYDANGRKTSSIRDWQVLRFDERYQRRPGYVTSLPMVVRDDAIGAVNPATGTLLWQRPIGRPHQNYSAGGFGTHVIITVGGGDSAYPIYLVDCYRGTGTAATGIDMAEALGTDGTRLAISTNSFEQLRVFGPDNKQLWDLAAATTTASTDARFVAVGGKVYQGTRRVI